MKSMRAGAYVYIVSNKSHRLYVCAAADLVQRVRQHKDKTYPNGFTARYVFDRLVYYEVTSTYAAALSRERQIKGWKRERKVALIQEKNPNWVDLSATWADLLLAE
jgi:putative endonuclease